MHLAFVATNHRFNFATKISMGLILNIETATEICSVCLAIDGKIVGIRESSEAKSHASQLSVFILELFQESKISAQDLDAVAISQGPGSYTGLRIGVSTAKGICYGSGKPLIAISSLLSLAKLASDTIVNKNESTGGSLLCPMIDARRMEVYAAIYDSDWKQIMDTKAVIVEPNSFTEYLNKNRVYFFGSGSDKTKDLIQHFNAQYLDKIEASSTGMVELAEMKYRDSNFENTAYFEPFYLKDFIATIPKKLI